MGSREFCAPPQSLDVCAVQVHHGAAAVLQYLDQVHPGLGIIPLHGLLVPGQHALELIHQPRSALPEIGDLPRALGLQGILQVYLPRRGSLPDGLQQLFPGRRVQGLRRAVGVFGAAFLHEGVQLGHSFHIIRVAGDPFARPAAVQLPQKLPALLPAAQVVFQLLRFCHVSSSSFVPDCTHTIGYIDTRYSLRGRIANAFLPGVRPCDPDGGLAGRAGIGYNAE